MTEYLAQYGYLVVALGALLEGETILLLSGFAAQEGSLDLALVLVIGALGAFAGDQFWFHMARRWGGAWLARRPHLVDKAATAMGMLERHSVVYILSFRFIIGMRNLGAMVIGLSRVSTRRFMVLNFLAASIWAFAVVSAGYLFGKAAVGLLDGIENIEKLVIAVVALLAAAFIASWLLRRWLLRRLG